MPRLYDHIDLRVQSLAEARTFYETLLSALGFTRKTEIPGWLQYEAEAPDGGPATFFGVTESTGHVPNPPARRHLELIVGDPNGRE